MELSELIFKSNTTDLERVSKVIGDLVTDISKLDKASRDAAKTEATLAKAAKDNAKANLDNAKAQDVRLKSTLAAEKADQANEKATISKTKAVESHTKASKENVSILQRQTDIYDFLAQGFSKGQASILASAKATGQYSKELEQVLELQKQFTSDPFDRSDTGLKRLQRTIKEVTDAQNYFNDGHNLTSKQARELSNDLDRLNAGMKQQGKSYQEIVKAQAVYKQQFLEEAKVVNQANSALAVVEKQRKEVVTATNYVTQADQRMAAALNISNAALDKAGTDSLVKYEMALRKSGIAQDVVTSKLATYKTQLAQVQAQEAKRAEQHLTRAISPQLMDIGVSLYSGQNPMTVLIQQSGQLVDLFQLSGVEASKLGEAMRKSFYSMVPAIATVTKGLGSLFIGMFYDAGKSITNFIGNVTGMNKVLQHTDDILYLIGGRVTWFSKILATLGTIASVTFGTGVLAIVAGLAALAVGLKQVITENNDLAKAFALSGASIGLSHTQVAGYVKTLADSGATTGQATEALLAMAKAGNFTSSEILLVSDSAIQMQKGFGIAIEDTVKQFAKLKEKPVEALLDIAKSTGMVGPEVIKMVQELEKAGRSTDAASVAMKAYADVTKQQVAQMKENYNGFALFMIDLGQKIKQFFSDTFKTLFLATDPNQQIEDQLVKLRERIKEVSGNLQSLGSFGDPKLLNQLKEQERMLISQIGANVRIRGEEERRKYLNAENAKYESAIAGLRENALDSIEKETRKTQTLAEFRKSFINDKLKEAAKEKSVDIEKLKLNTDLMNVLQQQADIEYKKTQKSGGSKSENYYATLMREATNNTIAANTATQELTKSEQKLLEVKADPRFAKLTATQQADVIAKYDAAIAAERQTAMTEKLAEAEEHRLKLLGKSEGIGKQYYADMQKLEEFAKVAGWSRSEVEELTRAIFMATPAWKAYEKALEEVNSAARKFNEDSIASQAATLKENESLDYRLSLLGKTTEEQKALSIEYNRANKLSEVRIKLAKQLRDIEADIEKAKKAGLPEEDYKNLIDAQVQARKDAAEQEKVINREVAVQYAEDLQKEFDAIKNGISDSIVTALFEGGKAGSKKIRDLVVAQLRKPVTMVVNAVVNTVLGNILGSLMGGSANAAMQMASGGSSGIMGMASNASSAYNLISSGINVASQSGTWLATKGANFALELGMEGASEMLGQFGAGMANTASWGAASQAASAGGAQLAGVVAGSLMNGFAGYGISKMLSGGYSAGGWVNTVTGIASAIPGVGPIAGVIGGAVNRVFGRKHTQTNLQGTFGGDSGFEGRWEDYYKGGLLRSSKSVYTPLEEDTRSALADEFNAMRFATAAMADVLGLGTAAISSFTASVNIKLKGLSAEDAQKKIQEEFDKIAESLAGTALGTDRYTRAGETSVQTLTRLATSLTGVNTAFENLGYTLYEASLAGGDMASQLVDLFGGPEQFNQATGVYMQNFYTEAEKTANVMNYLTSEFNKQNLVLPKTREDYRKLVESQDLTTESGRELFTVLLQLSPTFASVVSATEELTDGLDSLTSELLNRSVELQIEKLRLLGQEEQALAMERGIATKGMTDQQVAMWDANKAAEDYNETLKTNAELIKEISSSLPPVIKKFVSDEDWTNFQYEDVAKQLVTAGIGFTDVTQAVNYLTSATKDEIGKAATELFNMGHLTLEQKKVLIESAGLMADIKDASIKLAEDITNAFKKAGTDIVSYLQELATGRSGLATPTELLNKTRQVYTNTLSAAQGGDVEAAQRLVASAKDYIEAQKTVTTSSSYTSDVIKAVFDQLKSLGFVQEQLASPGAPFIPQFAQGAAFDSGIVSRPTMFSIGQMGEAGPEAIMPLTRTSSGGLGVVSTGDTNKQLLESILEELKGLREQQSGETTSVVTATIMTAEKTIEAMSQNEKRAERKDANKPVLI